MNIDEIETLVAQAPVTASPEVFQQLGAITRMLHDTLHQLGVMPRLQMAAEGLPDARSRLNYIAVKTAQAAERVLDSVDHAKAEHQRIAAELGAGRVAPPNRCERWLRRVRISSAIRGGHPVDQHLTPHLAQDFQDLTAGGGQGLPLAICDLADSLTQLLVQVVPPSSVRS